MYSLNRGSRHCARAAHVIASAPEGRQPRLQIGKLTPQLMRSEAFHLVDNVLRGVGGRRFEKQVDVIGHDFERDNLAVQLFGLAEDQCPQARLNAPGEYLAAVLGTPNEVVRHRRNTAAKVPIPLYAHNLIVRRYSIAGNENAVPIPAKSSRRPMRSPRYPSARLKPAVSRAGDL